MEIEFKDFKKYRWFYTKSGKLVVGGKSAEQNDNLLKAIIKQEEDRVIMHTSAPGSPFAVIISKIPKVTPSDLEETAIFTACFSRAWRAEQNEVVVDIFRLFQLYKSKSMKTGTWGIKGSVSHKTVKLELSLTKQLGVLRAVPIKTVNKSETLVTVAPGKIHKASALAKLQVEVGEDLSEEEVLMALPTGGIKIVRKK